MRTARPSYGNASSAGTGAFTLALASGLLITLAGCTPSPGTTGSRAYTPSPSAGAFLAEGSCAARAQAGGAVSFREVACGDPSAVAKVTVRQMGGDPGEPDCPDVTDFVLAVQGGSAAPAAAPSSRGSGEGYACMRDLRPPHPGDPGRGGGPNTIPGDCVYAAGGGEVKETACDGSGTRTPQYEIAAVVGGRADCPPSTELYVGVRKGKVGCARRV